MNSILSVSEATQLILNQRIDYGVEVVSIVASLGRTLAETLIADRDFPPFDRVTMDGIAIRFEQYEAGQKRFQVEGMQAAGKPQQTLQNNNNCLEVMTGASLPVGTDTVVRYEDISIENGFATINEGVTEKQNVHRKGEDQIAGKIIINEGVVLRSPEIAVAATIGKDKLRVKQLPTVAMITSGDELVNVSEVPLPHQIRHSNKYSIATLLALYNVPVTHFHIADDFEATKHQLSTALEAFDVLVLSGGVSMGKKDYIPAALEALGVEKIFHRIAQRPGKPFWFGKKDQKIVFALPGNPVSSFLCVRRYVIPWLHQCVNQQPLDFQYAALGKEVSFIPELTYFLQVNVQQNEKAQLVAHPIIGHGSGDFASLTNANAFIELPMGKTVFRKGEIFPVWHY